MKFFRNLGCRRNLFTLSEGFRKDSFFNLVGNLQVDWFRAIKVELQFIHLIAVIALFRCGLLLRLVQLSFGTIDPGSNPTRE